MREVFFVFTYGMLAMTGLFLTVYWGSVLSKRSRFLRDWKLIRIDRAFWLAAILVGFAAGMVLVGVARTWGNLVHGVSAIARGPEGYVLGAGLIFLLVSQTAAVWLADLDHNPPRWLWGMGIISILWSIAVVSLV